jgi:hypothetical protein
MSLSSWVAAPLAKVPSEAKRSLLDALRRRTAATRLQHSIMGGDRQAGIAKNRQQIDNLRLDD